MDLRKIIQDEMKRQGRSGYWLAENPGCGASKNVVYTYLRGDSDGTGQTIAAMLEALGMKVVSGGDNAPGKRQRPK